MPTNKTERIATIEEKISQLENQRKRMLAPDYKPNADWWGSVTKD